MGKYKKAIITIAGIFAGIVLETAYENTKATY